MKFMRRVRDYLIVDEDWIPGGTRTGLPGGGASWKAACLRHGIRFPDGTVKSLGLVGRDAPDADLLTDDALLDFDSTVRIDLSKLIWSVARGIQLSSNPSLFQ